MRTSFELKFVSTDYESAVNGAVLNIARFLGIPTEEVLDKVDVELKVELNEGSFLITAFGKIKTNFINFGLDKNK